MSDTRKHPTHAKHPVNTGYTIPTRIPYPILKLSRKVEECKPLTIGRIAALVAAKSGLETILATPDMLPLPPAPTTTSTTSTTSAASKKSTSTTPTFPVGNLEQFLDAADVALVVVLHAFKCGNVLDQIAAIGKQSGRTGPPTVLVLGGTDVNVDAGTAPDAAAALTRRAHAVDRVVSFSSSMVEAAPAGSLPGGTRMLIIPQGVSLPPSPEEAAAAAEAEAAAAAAAEAAATEAAAAAAEAAVAAKLKATAVAAEARWRAAEAAAAGGGADARGTSSVSASPASNPFASVYHSSAPSPSSATTAAAADLAPPSPPSPPSPPPPPPPPRLHEVLGLPRSVPVLLLPAGLRPIKDVLWAADALERAAAPALAAAAATAGATANSPPPFVLAVVGRASHTLLATL